MREERLPLLYSALASSLGASVSARTAALSPTGGEGSEWEGSRTGSFTLPSPQWGRGIRTAKGRVRRLILIPLPRRGGEGRVRGRFDQTELFMKILG
jgi:hypothetical protein